MDLVSNEQRAVKVIKKRYKTPDQLASFGNEIALMLASDHPNVLKAIDAFETKDDLFIGTRTLACVCVCVLCSWHCELLANARVGFTY